MIYVGSIQKGKKLNRHLFHTVSHGRNTTRMSPGNWNPVGLRHTYCSFNHCVSDILGTYYYSAKTAKPLNHTGKLFTEYPNI